MKIATTTITQSANDLLGVEARTLHYLVIENNKGNKLTINVGKKTHDTIKQLSEEEEPKTKKP